MPKYYKTHGFYNTEDIQKILECSKSKAYYVIKDMNKKRAEKNMLVVKGRIPVTDFNNYFFGEVTA